MNIFHIHPTLFTTISDIYLSLPLQLCMSAQVFLDNPNGFPSEEKCETVPE